MVLYQVPRTAPRIIICVQPEGLPKSKPIELTNEVLSLKYEDESEKADKLTLTIDNTDLSNFDEPIWRTGNLLFVRFGYSDMLSIERKLQIRKVSGFLELTIEALGMAMVLDREERVTAYQNARHSDVAMKIAQRWGYVDEKALHIEQTTRVYDTVNQGGISDAVMMRRLAQANGFQWYIDFDGFHFHRRSRTIKNAPLKVFRYRGADATPEILSIDIETDVTRIAGSATTAAKPFERSNINRIFVDGTSETVGDREAREAKEREAKGLIPTKKKLTTATTANKKDAPQADPGSRNIAHHKLMMTNEGEEAEIRRQAERHLAAAMQGVVKMTVRVIGDPNLYAKTLILVDGLGRRFSVPFYVVGVTHSIGTGYTTELRCESDAIGKHAASRFYPEMNVLVVGGGAGDGKKTIPAKPRGEGLLDENLARYGEAGDQRVIGPTGEFLPAEQPGPVVADAAKPLDMMSRAAPDSIAAPRPDAVTKYDATRKAASGATIDYQLGSPWANAPDASQKYAIYHAQDGAYYVVPTVGPDKKPLDDPYATFESTNAHYGGYTSEKDAREAISGMREWDKSQKPVYTPDPIHIESVDDSPPVPETPTLPDTPPEPETPTDTTINQSDMIGGPVLEVPPAPEPAKPDYSRTPEDWNKGSSLQNQVDLKSRPFVITKSGDTATIYSMTIPVSDHGEATTPDKAIYYTLVPGIDLDGNVFESDGDAWEYAKDKNQILGIWDTLEETNAAGEALHQQQVKYPPANRLASPRITTRIP